MIALQIAVFPEVDSPVNNHMRRRINVTTIRSTKMKRSGDYEEVEVDGYKSENIPLFCSANVVQLTESASH